MPYRATVIPRAMKPLRLFALACLLAASAASVARIGLAGQAARPPDTAAAQGLVVRSEYDRFADKTSVSVGPMRLKTARGDDLSLLVNFQHKGTVPPPRIDDGTPSDWLYLVFLSAAPAPLFTARCELTFLLDGKQRRFGTMKHNPRPRGSRVEENVSMFVGRDALAKLAGASRVEGRLGDYEFELSEAQIKALRDFLDRIPPNR